MRIRGIHHLTIAVRDIDSARETFARLFGAEASGVNAMPAFGIDAARLPLGDSALQLAAPLHADNPLTRFLERKGEGFYNVAIEVEDLDEAIAELVAQGVRVSEPVEAERGIRSSFVAMAATHGLSVQLVEVVRPETATIAATSHASAVPHVDGASVEATAIVDDARAEHLTHPPTEEDADTLPAAAPLDLTPDEWSDVD